MRYKIWERFPRNVLEEVVAQTYDHKAIEDASGYLPCPVTEAGFCPLGIALGGELRPRPDPMEIAEWFVEVPFVEDENAEEYQELLAEYDTVYNAADQFIEDWDAGLIEDLAEAVGLKEDSNV
jgi:hypothetical protein